MLYINQIIKPKTELQVWEQWRQDLESKFVALNGKKIPVYDTPKSERVMGDYYDFELGEFND